MRRSAAVAIVLAVLAVSAAPAARAAAGTQRPDPRRFLSVDAAHRVARLTLLAGSDGANDGFNFDGYGRGRLLVTIPLDWRVVVSCENRGGVRHSCAIVRGPLATRPAFAGAATQAPLAGLSPGAREHFSFLASRVGSYRIACLVPGHEQARMWDVLDVVRGGRPAIVARVGF